MTPGELFVGAGAAVVMVLCLVLVSHAVVWSLCPSCDAPTRWVGMVAVLAWLPTALFHTLALPHAFTRWVAVISLVVLAAAAWMASGRALVRRRFHRDWVFFRRVGSRFRRSPYRFAALAFALCALPPVLRAVVLPPLGWDTLTYHSVKAALWVQSGGAGQLNGIGPWAYYRDMPGGAEVLLAWAMLPLSSDAFSGLLDIVEWIGVGVSAMVVARRIGVREPFASTAAGFIMAVPVVRLMLGSAYVELCLLSTCLAGLALALAASRTRPGPLLLAGGAFGVSAAAKLPMIVVTSIPLGLAVLWFLRQGHPNRARWATASVAAYCVALGPWLVAAAMHTGAPLSPLPVTVGSLVLGVAPPEFAWYLDRYVSAPFQIWAEWSVLQAIFSSPFSTIEGAGLLTLIPIASACVAVPRLWQSRRASVVVMLGMVLGCLATFYSPTFSVVRHGWSVNSGRFLLPAIAIAVILGVSWCRPRSVASRGYWIVLILCALWHLVQYALVGFSRTSVFASAGVLAVVAGVAAAGFWIAKIQRLAWRWGLAAPLVFFTIIALQLSRDGLRPALLQHDFTLHGFAEWRYWAPWVGTVDQPGHRHRIAVTSGPRQNSDHWFAYPFMGRRFQNDLVYVPISGDGKIRHFGAGFTNEELVHAGSSWAWRIRLQRQKITHVLSFGPESTELVWMVADPDHFERVAGEPGDTWGIFRVKS